MKTKTSSTRINRQQFLNDLKTLKAGLSPREFIEQSACFVFQDGMVMTFNDEVACRKKIGGNLTGAVQAQELLDILRKVEDAELEVRDNGGGLLEFKGKRRAFGVTKEEKVFLPIDSVTLPTKWQPLPTGFTEAIKGVLPSVSNDYSRFLLMCIHIHPEFIEACNNHQVKRCAIKTDIPHAVLVRGSSLKPLINLGMSEMAVTKTWIHFRNPSGLMVSCRCYPEEYPVLDSLLEIKDGQTVTFPKELAKATERAAVFADEKVSEPVVKVEIRKNMVEVAGEGVTGYYKEQHAIEYAGPALKFLIDPATLADISKAGLAAVVGEHKLRVRNQAHNWAFVTVLGNPDAPKATAASGPA